MDIIDEEHSQLVLKDEPKNNQTIETLKFKCIVNGETMKDQIIFL